MGSLTPYHVVLMVNSVQETAIRDVFYRHDWVCFMKAVPDNVVDGLVKAADVDGLVKAADEDVLSFLQLPRDDQSPEHFDLSADGNHTVPRDAQSHVPFDLSADENHTVPRDAQSHEHFDLSADVNHMIPRDSHSHAPFDLSSDVKCTAADSKSVYENYTTVTFDHMENMLHHTNMIVAAAEMPESYMAGDVDNRCHYSVQDDRHTECIGGEMVAEDMADYDPDQHGDSGTVTTENNLDGIDKGGTCIGGNETEGFCEVKVEREASVDREADGMYSSSSTITASTDEETLSNVENVNTECRNNLSELDEDRDGGDVDTESRNTVGELDGGRRGDVGVFYDTLTETDLDDDESLLVDFRDGIVKGVHESNDMAPEEEQMETVSDVTAANNITEAPTTDHGAGTDRAKQDKTLPVVNIGDLQVKLTTDIGKLYTSYMKVTNRYFSNMNQISEEGEQHTKEGEQHTKEGEQYTKEGGHHTKEGDQHTKGSAPAMPDTSVRTTRRVATNSQTQKKTMQTPQPRKQTVIKSGISSNCEDPNSEQITASDSDKSAESKGKVSDDSQQDMSNVGNGRSAYDDWQTSGYTFGNKNLTDSAHKCAVCQGMYLSERLLRRHMFKRHRELAPKFSCDVCYNQYYTRDQLRAHRRESGHIASQSETFQCELCGQCLKRKETLRNHMKCVHSDEYRYPCEICGTMFKTVVRVKAHKKSFHTIEPTTCDICGKTFPRKRLMTDHRKRHAISRDFACEECGKAFINKQLLKQHHRVHSGERPFKCSLCTYACAIKQNLVKHMRVHNKTKV